MKTHRFWIAALLSVALHLAPLSLCYWAVWGAPDTPPELLEAYGDSDREGFNVSTIALNPGTYRQGDQHTPGGDDAPEKGDASTSDDENEDGPIAMEAPLQVPTPSKLPVVLPDPASVPMEKPVKKAGLPGAPGGADMALGTPSRGGIVGSLTGVKRLGLPAKVYPAEAERLELEGTPVVWLKISAEGVVVEAKLHKSCGYDILDRAAVRYAQRMRFRPALRGDTPVESTCYQEVEYRLP
jgi:protein TonB